MRTSTPGRPAGSLATAVYVLAAIAIGLVVLDAIVDHRPAQGGGRRQAAPDRPSGGHDHGGSASVHEHGAHRHEPVPAAYARMHAPPGLWTDSATLTRGEAIYRQHCAVCHGERGDGRGPGAAQLTPKPADMTDRGGVAEMTDSYWFWRVSEGGRVEPFTSRGSAMPAWKDVLSSADRWAVIAYQHTFSGHRGAHGRAQHPEMRATGSSR